MIEGTPGVPYGGLMSCFNVVESNMILRRAEATQLLKKNESILSVSFPSLGVPDFTDPPAKPAPEDESGAGRSIFFPDEAIYSGHPRFKNLVRNIRGRRGRRVAINVPIFKVSGFNQNLFFIFRTKTLLLHTKKNTLIQKPLKQLCPIIFTLIIWVLAWVVVVFK